jgi:signal transduction histidine kinase
VTGAANHFGTVRIDVDRQTTGHRRITSRSAPASRNGILHRIRSSYTDSIIMLSYWIKSLSVRLWVTSVAALAVSLTLIAAIVLYAFNHLPPDTFRVGESIRGAHKLASELRFDESGQPVSIDLDERTKWLFDFGSTELMYRALDASGHVLLASRGAPDIISWGADDLASSRGVMKRVTINGKPFDVVTLEVMHGQTPFFLQSAASVAFNKAVLGEKIEPIPAIVGDTLLIATIIFGLTLTFTVRRVLRPLRVASDAAASITPQNLRMRLSIKGVPSEIKPILIAFNDALARLENGFAVQQQFLASAAHELQTPLTLIRGQIELQPEVENKDLLFREIDLMARQVRQLLHLAEVSESQNFEFGEVDKVDVAEDVVDYLARKADKKQVKLHVDAPVIPATMRADRSALFILLKNIVENAINATPSHGSVIVSVDEKTICVQDEGPGVDPDHLPFLFERFWRAPDAQHDGAGLGLSICKEIALAHNWKLSVKTLASGTQFIVSF